MPFFEKANAKLPEELRDASNEELLEAVKFFKENKDKFASQTTELETTKQSLTNMETQHKATADKLAALEASIAEATRQKQAPPPAPDEPVDFFTDPDKAFNQRQGPRDMLMLNTAAQVAQLGFEGSLISDPGKFGDDPKIYKKYQREVVDLMRREPLMNQANNVVWKNAFLLVKGLHADEIAEARKSQDSEFFGEPGRPKVAPDTKPKDEVSEDDRKAARRYGITPESVFEARKGMKVVNVP